MKTIEIYWNDLTPEKQQEIFEALGGENGNYDVFPIATLEFEDEEDENNDSISKTGAGLSCRLQRNHEN